MPITTSKTASDPYAPLSWSTSLVLVALQKLRIGRGISPEESTALSTVARELTLLSEASAINVEKTSVAVPPHLRQSFFTLVAIQEKATPQHPPIEFKRAGEDLEIISRQLQSGKSEQISREALGRAQRICLELLEQLNDQRPTGALF